jgi:hypothetical protein
MKELVDLEKEISAFWLRLMTDKKLQRSVLIALLVVCVVTNWEELKTGFAQGLAQGWAGAK